MRIVKGQENIVSLTLAEKSTLNDSQYIIKFVNELSGEKTQRVIAVDNISDYDRYDKFIITETTVEDLQNAHVNLNPPGQWTYTAYEMPSTSPRSLDISLAIGIVEEDICFVDGVDEIRNFLTDDENKNNGVFDA